MKQIQVSPQSLIKEVNKLFIDSDIISEDYKDGEKLHIKSKKPKGEFEIEINSTRFQWTFEYKESIFPFSIGFDNGNGSDEVDFEEDAEYVLGVMEDLGDFVKDWKNGKILVGVFAERYYIARPIEDRYELRKFKKAWFFGMSMTGRIVGKDKLSELHLTPID